MTHTHGRTRDPGYDLHVPWEIREGESVYNNGCCGECWKREWIGGKEIYSLGAAHNHVMATWLMGVIVRVE